MRLHWRYRWLYSSWRRSPPCRAPSPGSPASTKSAARSATLSGRITTAEISNGSSSSSPRAAGKLLEMLPTVQVGTSRLVDREVLLGFLGRVRDADDTAKLFEEIRTETAAVSRRKPRSLVRRDLEPIGIASLPSSITLSPGRMEVRFTTVEELAEAMYALARVLEAEGEEFAGLYGSAGVISTSPEKRGCDVTIRRVLRAS